MECSIFLVLFLCLIPCPDQALALKKLAKHTIIKNLECTWYAKMVTNVVCTHVDVADYSTNLTVQFRFIRPMAIIFAQIKTMRMEYGVYKVSGMVVQLDFCMLGGGASHPIIDIFFPIFRKGIGALLHACPYSGNFSLANLTVPPVSLERVARQGQKLRTEVSFLRGKHAPFLTLIVLSEAKYLELEK